MTRKLIAALLLLSLTVLSVCAYADGTLNVMNYGEYIDEEVIRNFEKERIRRQGQLRAERYSGGDVYQAADWRFL